MPHANRFAVAGLVVALAAPATARPAHTPSAPSAPAAVQSLEFTHFEPNQLGIVLSNAGSFAFDAQGIGPGLSFPAGSSLGVVFAGGLWLGSTVGGAPRVTVAEYSWEYVPGAAPGGIREPSANPALRVYTLRRNYPTPLDATLALEDYNNNALSRGAPVVLQLPDGSLNVPGDMMAWSVCNDLDQLAHTSPLGSTGALQLEVQSTTWAYNRPGPFGRTVFQRYKLINRGPNTLGNMYVGLWCDPDVGGSVDDRVGSVPAASLAYAYNGAVPDADYGNTPPAVGYDLLQGPFSTSLGARLPATSLVSYVNGTDPSSYQEASYSLQGLDNTGAAFVDPVANASSKFHFTGDPVAGTGWLDPVGADKRFLLASGPFSMAPGSQQEIVLAILVAIGPDRLASVAQLKQDDALVQTAFDTNQLGVLDVPADPHGATLSLRRVFPNPTHGTLRAEFTLPAPGDATLELLDLSGRRVAWHATGALGAGPQGQSLDTRGLPAGLYFLRLQQAGRSTATRVVIGR